MKDDALEYMTRPAIELDYEYCRQLTHDNMLELFTRHWGGWVDSIFERDFDVDATTIVLLNGQKIGYFSLKKDDRVLNLNNLQPSSFVRGKGIGSSILQSILKQNQ